MNFAALEGKPTLPLDGSVPALRPCRYCGCKVGYLSDPKGPHANGVRCDECGRYLGWMPRVQSDEDFDVIE